MGDTSGDRQWVMGSLLPPPKCAGGPLAGYQATEPEETPFPLSDKWVRSQVQQTAVI